MRPSPKRARLGQGDRSGVELLLAAIADRQKIVFVTGAGLSVLPNAFAALADCPTGCKWNPYVSGQWGGLGFEPDGLGHPEGVPAVVSCAWLQRVSHCVV